MATLTVQEIIKTGVTPAYDAASAGGDQFANTGNSSKKRFIHVKNGGGAGITATVNSQKNCDQGFDHDLAVSVGAGAEKLIGPIESNRFNDSSGNVQITYSDDTSVTIAVLEME